MALDFEIGTARIALTAIQLICGLTLFSALFFTREFGRHISWSVVCSSTSLLLLAAASLIEIWQSVFGHDLAILLSDGLAFASVGFSVLAARLFFNLRLFPYLVFSPVLVWVIFWLISDYSTTVAGRLQITAVLGGSLAVSIAYVYFRRNTGRLIASYGLSLLAALSAIHMLTLGVLSLQSDFGTDPIEDRSLVQAHLIFLLIYIASKYALIYTLVIEFQQRHYRQAAYLDSLTGLRNRRALFDDAEQALTGKGRVSVQQPYALAMLDIDHFKQVNDTYGHSCGDKVLELLGSMLREDRHLHTISGRSGGEEFILVFPGAGMSSAFVYVDKLRMDFETRTSALADLRNPVTLSAGLSHCLIGDTSLETSVFRADEALYSAKKAGRNRIVVSGGGSQEPGETNIPLGADFECTDKLRKAASS